MSVSIALSVDVLTDRAILIIGLAVVALLAAGWRKPARASVRSPRAHYGVPVDQQPIRTERPVGLVRRLLALATTGALAVVSGTIIAVSLSFGAVWGVIKLTDLLGR
ncbi:hypothetical protein N9E02_01260 [Ilumatobacteraceae bacterium]|nr:hypothetical protein [Ilumatobacteraceae bacterium]